MLSRKKGFTLVELLIVIVVIGVLSAMMMLSSTEAVSSAKAANIVNNMRNIKTAVLEWYADNIDNIKIKSDGQYVVTYFDGNTSKITSRIHNTLKANANFKQAMTKYLSNADSISLNDGDNSGKPSIDGFAIVDGSIPQDTEGKKYLKWFVAYRPTSDTRLKAKLADKAKTATLFKNGKGEYYTENAENYIYMPILTLGE
ncbi:MAG: type II secretion system protein [Synergistaceae bacterium]|nr:type II secretion system protein [Synergistaceae bacterium]